MVSNSQMSLMTPARRTTPARQHINKCFPQQRKSFVSTRSYKFVNTRIARTEYEVTKITRNELQYLELSYSKFTEKMAIYDYYITESNNRQKGGKDERKRRLFHKFIWHTCFRQNRTITTITGVIFNYLEI